MSPEELKKLIDDGFANMKALADKQTADIKAHGKVSEETELEAKDLKLKMDTLEKSLDIKSIKAYEDRITALEKKANRPGGPGAEVVKSIGNQFVESEVVKSHIAAGGRGNSESVTVTKAIVNAAGSAAALTDNYRNPTVYMNPDRPTFIRDLVNHIPVQDSGVEIMRELVFTNSAAPQADAIAGVLQSKAESTITYSLETIAVVTIAHFIIASRQVLADAPRLAAMIDSRLVYGINLEYDAQLLYGDGTGQNFTGLLVDADVSDVGQITAGTTAAELPAAMIDHIRSAVTQCQLFNYINPNGVVLNPEDWETIETAKGTDGHYIWVSVTDGGETRLWKMPVVVSNAITKGDFILGDWTMGATLYDREGMTVRTSESHANLFIQNGVAILGEERSAFGIELPKAFCKGDFTVAV